MAQHVKILAILHIVLGGLGVLAALIILAVFGGVAGLIHMTDTSADCNYYNKRWEEFTGKPVDQLYNDGWDSLVHPNDLRNFLQAYNAAFADRKEYTLEYRLRRSDGEYRWISDHGIPRYLHDGTFVGYIGTCTDITERKMIREELEQKVDERTKDIAEQRDFITSILDNSVDQITVLDKEMRFLAFGLAGPAPRRTRL